MKTRRNIILTAIVALFLSIPSPAQIFITEDESNMRSNVQEEMGVIPINGATWDQTNELFTPLGEGWMLLIASGGVYLLKKKKKYNK